MEFENKLKLNKKIREYEGENTFILSLQKQLKSKYVSKEAYKNRTYKVLSDKQYEAALSILDK